MYRLSVFKCLINRALQLCSTWSLFHIEIQAVRSMLLRNAYPARVLDNIIKHLVSFYKNPVVKFGPQKERMYIGLPYLGKSVDPLRRSIQNICRKFIPNKELIIFSKPGKVVKNFFRLKDSTPFDLQSCVVYKYTCAGCHASYIGQTTRHLRHRYAEHKGVSHLTFKVVKSLVHSSIRDHCLQCNSATCKLEDFTVLARGGSDLELLVKERLLIAREKPVLNVTCGSCDLLLH